MLVVPSDGLEAGEILFCVIELELGTSGPPLGVCEGTEPSLCAENIVLARLHTSRGGGGCPPSPPVHLLPPLLDHHTVGKFAPTVGKESAGVTIPAWPRPTMFGLHVILHFTLVKALDFTFSTLDGSQENSLFLHHW